MRLPALALAIALAGAALASTSEAAAQAAPKIIIVDVKRAVLDTEEGLRVQASLKRLFDVRQRDLSDLDRQVQTRQAAVQQKLQGGTPQSAMAKEIEELQKIFTELSQKRDQYQNEMLAREQQLTAPIFGRVLGLVRKIAQEKGADYIVDRTAAAYYRADLEVTDRAIQMYNSGETAPPAAGSSIPVITKPGTTPAPAKPITTPAPAAPAKKP